MKAILLSLSIGFIFYYNAKAENIKSKIIQNNTFQKILIIKDDIQTPEEIAYDISVLGYTSEMSIPDTVTQELLERYDLVILSTGGNLYGCRNSDMRLSLQDYITYGGKAIIEGGDNGYTAAVYPFYLGFRNKVLKILGWTAHNGGDLNMNLNFYQNALALYPNTLPQTLSINFTQDADQDVCVKNEFTDIFYSTSFYPQNIGILVYPSVLTPQVINLSFNYLAVDNRSDVMMLLENCLWNLIGEPVGISSNNTVIPSEFKLEQNYPNPFNPVTKIKFDIPSVVKPQTPALHSGGSNVKLIVYNIIGLEISTLVDENLSEGSYEVTFDGTDLSGGVYYYKLVAGDFTETKKMVLIK